MSDSDLPPDSHHTPQEEGDAAEQEQQTAAAGSDAVDPAANDSDGGLFDGGDGNKDGNEDLDGDGDGNASDNESELSDVDEATFAAFDPTLVLDLQLNNNKNDRPVVMDEEITKGLKASKIKRTDKESKKKEAKRAKPKKKRAREVDDDDDGEEEVRSKRTRTSKSNAATGKEKTKGRKKAAVVDKSTMTPEQRRIALLNEMIDAAVKPASSRRRTKKDEVDLEEAFDDEIAAVKIRMEHACRADNHQRETGHPATHKLAMLPEVLGILSRHSVQDSVLDPDTNFLQNVRFFLEPLNDCSLPAYNIQRDVLAALAKLPIQKDTLLASGIGKVICYYTRSQKPEPQIKRQAQQLLDTWMRPILKKSVDYRNRKPAESADPRASAAFAPRSAEEIQRDQQREELLKSKSYSNRARLEGPSVASYTIRPNTEKKPSTNGARARTKPVGAAGNRAFEKLIGKNPKPR